MHLQSQGKVRSPSQMYWVYRLDINLALSLIPGRTKMAFIVYRDLSDNYNVSYSLENCLVPTLPLLLGWLLKIQSISKVKNPISRLIAEVTIIFCCSLDGCLLPYLFLSLQCTCTYHLLFPWCVVWWCLSCLFPHILPPLVPQALHSQAIWHA